MDFREISDGFIDENSKQGLVSNPASVIFHVRSWTKSDLYLANLILQLILKDNFEISSGAEESRVAEFVKTHIIQNWESQAAATYLNTIRDKILDNSQRTKILLKLHNILSLEEVQADESLEVQTLVSSTLVVVDGRKLKVLNPIYEAVFSREWVEGELNSIPTGVSSSGDDPPSVVPVWKTWMSQASPYLNFRFLSSVIAGLLFLIAIPFILPLRLSDSSPNNGGGGGGDKVVKQLPVSVPGQISIGERELIEKEQIGEEKQEFRDAKKKGIEALTKKDYNEAASQFDKALQAFPNAPETRIYLNNAVIEAENQRSYTIAVVAPIADDLDAAQAMLRGVAQAQNEINQADGINGVYLKVAIADDGGDLETAKKVASELGGNGEILGVVGHYYSGLTIETASIYQEKRLPIISLSSSVSISGLSNYIFRTSPSDDVTAEKLAEHMLTKWDDRKRVAIFYDSQSSYSISLKDEFEKFVKDLGGEVVSSFDWPKTNNQHKKLFDQAIAEEAQVLMLVPSSASQTEHNVVEIAELNNESGANLKLMGGDVAYSSEILKKSHGTDFLGMVVGAFWDIDTARNRTFVDNSQRLWNADVNWITAMSYDAAKAWIRALEIEASQENSIVPNRAKLQEILNSSDFTVSDGASGEISFARSGDRENASVQLVEVVQGDITSTQYDFKPVQD